MNFLCFVKGEERYIFVFDNANKVEIMRQLGVFAANPELSFTWHDAAFVTWHVKNTKSL